MKLSCKFIADGIYACKWKKRNLFHRSERTSIRELFFFAILTIIFLFCIVWLYSVAVFTNDSDNVNHFIFQRFKTWFHWYLTITVVSSIIVGYLLLLFLIGLYKIIKRSLHLFFCHKIFIFICLAVCVAGFVGIDIFYPEVWKVILASFDTTGIFLQIASIFLWTLLSIYIGFILKRFSTITPRIIVYFVYCLVFFFLFSIPFWVSSPCIGPTAFSNSKPLLIGHRGAPTLGPENTLFSFEKSLSSCNVSVLESDVRVSSDGIPFLMHDDNLRRTTNVAEVFPDRKNDFSETFSWFELQRLNAGNWFLETDPFFSSAELTEADKINIRQQKIPSLTEYLTLAAKNNVSVIFDVLRPPQNQSYHNSWIDVVLNTTLNSTLPPRQVLWIKTDESERLVNQISPGFEIVSPDPPNQQEIANGTQIFNLLYSTITENTVSFNSSLIAYTINQNWAFSRAWCQGIWAVTTDQCPEFSKLDHPSWRITMIQYLSIWISVNVFFLLLVICFFVGCERSRKPPDLKYTRSQSFDDVFTISGTQHSLVL